MKKGQTNHMLILIAVLAVVFLSAGIIAIVNKKDKNSVDEDAPMIDATVKDLQNENQTSSDSSSTVQNKKDIKISKTTIDKLGDSKEDILKAIDGLLSEEDDYYKGKVSEDDISNIKDSFKSEISNISSESLISKGMSFSYNIDNANITITGDLDKMSDIEDDVNTISLIIGCYQQISNPTKNWVVIINIYDKSNSEKVGSYGVSEDESFVFSIKNVSTDSDAE